MGGALSSDPAGFRTNPPCPEFGASNDMKNTKHQAAWPAGPRLSGSPGSAAGAAGETPGESEQQIRAILAHAAKGIITITEDGLVETFNPAAEKLFGYTADEMAGQSINILMPGSEATAHDGYIRAYLETGRGQDNRHRPPRGHGAVQGRRRFSPSSLTLANISSATTAGSSAPCATSQSARR